LFFGKKIVISSLAHPNLDLTNVVTMVAIITLVGVVVAQLAITASAGDCKAHQFYCGAT
jgi:hypothetical protein